MGTFSFEASTEIEAPITSVWEYLTTHDEWRRPFIQSVRPLSDGPMEVGSRYENEAKLGPRKLKVVNEITVHDPPRKLGWRQVSDGPVVTEKGSYVLAAVGEDRTRFTLSVRGSTHGFTAILTPLLQAVMPRLMGKRFTSQLRDGVRQAVG